MPGLRSALADNPFRERLWGQLMLALYRSGRQADALETFQEARRVLADELGLEPGLELRRLQEAILAHDPAIAAVPVDRRRRGNLPAPSTSFVGREDELAQVAGLLREHRLVTLTGPPGVGKSRLAVEAARSLEHEFPEGIWLVDFARAGDAQDAVRLLADAVDVRGSDPLARVTSRLRDAGARVVLDACEHVLEEAARIASTLLAECPGVRILATSREALRVASEVRVPVAPLALPDDGTGAGALRRSSSSSNGRGRHGPDSSPTPRSGARGGDRRRVDGLPLAIELAAARVNVLGLAELVSILERRAALLRDTPAMDPGRIALQGLVEWSYELLHEDEKTLLQQLAVHRGGASPASLGAVAASGLSSATVAYLVAALVDKSIVWASFSAASPDTTCSIPSASTSSTASPRAMSSPPRAPPMPTTSRRSRTTRGCSCAGGSGCAGRAGSHASGSNLWGCAREHVCDAPDPGVAIRLGTLGGTRPGRARFRGTALPRSRAGRDAR